MAERTRTRHQRLTRATAGLPVIVCTAATRLVRDVQDYLSGMGIGVVLKPFDIDNLIAAVNRPWADTVHFDHEHIAEPHPAD